MKKKKLITGFIGGRLENLLNALPDDIFYSIEEIRIRMNKPVIIKASAEYFIDTAGGLTNDPRHAEIADELCISRCLEIMSNYSLYAFEEELKNGYITLTGGHRVGLCGKVIAENRQIKMLRSIGGINIRVCHEIIGCADKVMPYITKPEINHTMIISPPGCGKTTMLRDIVRQLSDKEKQTVAVADERSEIAGCYNGVPQNDIGIRTDVLDACPKEEGMLMLLRAMSPEVIAVDEIGKKQEAEVIEEIANAGVKLMCTAHGGSIEDVMTRPYLRQLIRKRIFKRFIILKYGKTAGETEDILDQDFKSLYKRIREM